MPKIKNTSGADLVVPQGVGARAVLDGQVITVPEGETFGYTQQESTWAPADDDAHAEHDAALAAIADLIGAASPVGPETPAADAAKAVGDMTADEVAALVAAEQTRDKPRKTVLAAAEKRLDELTNNTPED